jgi:hypothetical protein
MDDWDGFYTLIGGTAGALIGLIFVVITLGMEHAKEGDTDRTRLFVTPILAYFEPTHHLTRHDPAAVGNHASSCSRRDRLRWPWLHDQSRIPTAPHGGPDEVEPMWDMGLPIAAYALLVFSAAAWALKAAFADLSGAAVTILLIAALRKSWVMTLFIASRKRKDAGDS